MTDKINAIIERSSTDIQRAPIFKSVVNRDGSRAIDTASITIPAGYRVSVNDTVSYIQDDAALTYLVALWNFQGSTRDESGYHHDGDTAPAYIEPEGTGNTKAYRSNYGLNFTTAGQEVTVADNTNNGVSNGDLAEHDDHPERGFNPTTLDFRQQFDIIINFKSMDDGAGTPTNTTQILFSKHDGTNGVEIGIKQVSGKWVIYGKLDSTTFTGDGTLYAISTDLGKIEHGNGEATRCIRFYRDHTNRVRLSLDDSHDGNDCSKVVATNTNARPTTALKIGSNGTDDFKGYIFQIRVYCGGYLNDNDFQTLMSAGAQQMTQKISGNVWRREEKLDSQTLEIRSRSRSILDREVNFDIIGDDTTNTDKPASHTKNLFDGGEDISDVLQTIIKYVDSDFVYLKSPAITSPIALAADGQYLATGRFITNVELLTTLANRSFLTFPTKTFVWEENTDGTSTELNTGYIFSDSEYQIYNRGEDDTKIINDLELFGDLQFGYHEVLFNLVDSFTEDVPWGGNTFAYPPLNVEIVQGTNTLPNGLRIPQRKYDIDFNNKTLTFNDLSTQYWSWGIRQGDTGYTDNGYVWAKYNYEMVQGVTGGYGGTDLTIRHVKTPTASETNSGATTSQGVYGRRSAKIYMPQLLRRSDLRTMAQKILLRSKDSKRRYTIKAPFLINCLRENLQVTLSSTVMKFTNSSGTAEDEPTTLEPVKSIEWKYPECTTTIECGDHVYDLYDSAKSTNDVAGGTQGSILKTQSDA